MNNSDCHSGEILPEFSDRFIICSPHHSSHIRNTCVIPVLQHTLLQRVEITKYTNNICYISPPLEYVISEVSQASDLSIGSYAAADQL